MIKPLEIDMKINPNVTYIIGCDFASFNSESTIFTYVVCQKNNLGNMGIVENKSFINDKSEGDKPCKLYVNQIKEAFNVPESKNELLLDIFNNNL